jgi:hypothetical protein
MAYRIDMPVVLEAFADRIARIDTRIAYGSTPMRNPLSPRIVIDYFLPAGQATAGGGGGGSALNRGLN